MTCISSCLSCHAVVLICYNCSQLCAYTIFDCFIDHKVYPLAEETPWGIAKVEALSISDANISNRKICIIDSGYDLNHTDLPSGPSVTGYEGDLTPFPWYEDGCTHGTHVTGIIAAIGGNDEGVKGVIRNGQANLHIVRMFKDDCRFAWGSQVAAAADICADEGSDVINMSLGCSGSPICYSEVEREVYRRLYEEENVLVVAAAGNNGNTDYSYPASYDNVLSVGATDIDDVIADFSQYNDMVDVSAPGVGVKSTITGNNYAIYDGTSMASPHTAGVAALIWSHHPNMTNSMIREALVETALDLGAPGRDDFYGHGRIRAVEALEYLNVSIACLQYAFGLSFANRWELLSLFSRNSQQHMNLLHLQQAPQWKL